MELWYIFLTFKIFFLCQNDLFYNVLFEETLSSRDHVRSSTWTYTYRFLWKDYRYVRLENFTIFLDSN
jgi:hypothetical protein